MLSTTFDVVNERRGTAMIVTVTGELDVSTARDLSRALKAAEADEPELIVVDLQAVPFIDSTGLIPITRLVLASEQGRHRVAIVRGPPQLDHVFHVSGLDRKIDLVDDVAAAIAASA
jgi:anti-sigma B factor antagonist